MMTNIYLQSARDSDSFNVDSTEHAFWITVLILETQRDLGISLGLRTFQEDNEKQIRIIRL